MDEKNLSVAKTLTKLFERNVISGLGAAVVSIQAKIFYRAVLGATSISSGTFLKQE